MKKHISKQRNTWKPGTVIFFSKPCLVFFVAYLLYSKKNTPNQVLSLDFKHRQKERKRMNKLI